MTLRAPIVLLPAGANRLARLAFDGKFELLETEPLLELASEESNSAGAAPNAAGWLAVPVESGSAIRLFRTDAGRIELRMRLPVPSGYEVTCCTVHGHWLFAGGSVKKSRLSVYAEGGISLLQCDLRSGEPELRPVAMPEEVTELRKAIDDLAVVGGELVALDNIIIPKFLLRFDLADLPDLRYVGRVEFAHGTYESADRLVAGDGWAAVLSTTVGGGGSSTHVSLWLMPYWRPVAVLSTHRPMFARSGAGSDEWRRIAAMGSWLFIESTSRGLGMVNVPDLAEAWRRARPLDTKGDRLALHLEPLDGVAWVEEWRGALTGIDERSALLVGAERSIVLDDRGIRRVMAGRAGYDAVVSPPT